MSFGFLGIQFGWGLQMANMSAIYSYLGANADALAILWLAAPVTGVIIQPLVGHYSDRIWTRLGRRRPFILGGAILASLALVLMPNCPAVWMAAGLLWVLDGTINASMQPFRALVADNLPEEQNAQGFAIQSLFIGLGGTVASALPWMMTNWFGVTSEGAGQGHIPNSVRLSFYIGAAAFMGAVLWTVFSAKEYPPSARGSLIGRSVWATSSRWFFTCPGGCGNWDWFSSSPGSGCSRCGSILPRPLQKTYFMRHPARWKWKPPVPGRASVLRRIMPCASFFHSCCCGARNTPAPS
jgi:Na+/melibiose symporter-like transporter